MLPESLGRNERIENSYPFLYNGLNMPGFYTAITQSALEPTVIQRNETAKKPTPHSQATVPDNKRGRGRRKRVLTPESLDAQKKKRQEQNKLHAKENREKKKKYIEMLRNEVTYYLNNRTQS